MIVTRQKQFDDIVASLAASRSVFITGCARCATACNTGGESEVAAMTAALTDSGIAVAGSAVLDEGCHMPLTGVALRKAKETFAGADAVLVLACGAGVTSVAAAAAGKKVVAGLDSLFLGNTMRLGQFQHGCSICGDCLLTVTGGVCPVTHCAKALLNGPCGGMEAGRCESNADIECAWSRIHDRLKAQARHEALEESVPPRDHRRKGTQ